MHLEGVSEKVRTVESIAVNLLDSDIEIDSDSINSRGVPPHGEQDVSFSH